MYKSCCIDISNRMSWGEEYRLQGSLASQPLFNFLSPCARRKESGLWELFQDMEEFHFWRSHALGMRFRTLARFTQSACVCDRTRPVTMQYGVGHVTSTISLALPTSLQKSQKGSPSPQILFSWRAVQGNWKGAGLARLATRIVSSLNIIKVYLTWPEPSIIFCYNFSISHLICNFLIPMESLQVST